MDYSKDVLAMEAKATTPRIRNKHQCVRIQTLGDTCRHLPVSWHPLRVFCCLVTSCYCISDEDMSVSYIVPLLFRTFLGCCCRCKFSHPAEIYAAPLAKLFVLSEWITKLIYVD